MRRDSLPLLAGEFARIVAGLTAGASEAARLALALAADATAAGHVCVDLAAVAGRPAFDGAVEVPPLEALTRALRATPLVASPGGEESSSPVTLVVHWNEELKKR